MNMRSPPCVGLMLGHHRHCSFCVCVCNTIVFHTFAIIFGRIVGAVIQGMVGVGGWGWGRCIWNRVVANLTVNSLHQSPHQLLFFKPAVTAVSIFSALQMCHFVWCTNLSFTHTFAHLPSWLVTVVSICDSQSINLCTS